MHVLVNSMIRCGGSLLARMLDGHPAVMSMPIEMSYATRKVFWTNLKNLCMLKDIDGLVRDLNLARSLGKLARGRITKDIYGKADIKFDYDAFIEDLHGLLRKKDPLTPHDAVDCIFQAFFQHWDGGAHHPGPDVRATVNHLSMMCFADPLTFREFFNPGLMIQPVRDPRPWYSSMKRLFGVENDHSVFLPVSITLWAEATIRAFVHSRFFKFGYRLVRLEDLLVDPEGSMRALCSSLNIEYDPVLVLPTMGGRPWLGNSSDGPMQGIEISVLTRWKEVITPKERNFIEDQCGGLMRILGYAGDRLEPILSDAHQVTIPLLRAEFNLDPADDLARLRDESRRMSILLHYIYNESIMRHLCGRYTMQSTGGMGILKRLLKEAFGRR